jgi:hypothetical protein
MMRSCAALLLLLLGAAAPAAAAADHAWIKSLENELLRLSVAAEGNHGLRG